MPLIRWPCQRMRYAILVLLAVVLFLGFDLFHLLEPTATKLKPEPTGPLRLPVEPDSCQAEVQLLRRPSFDLTDQILYSRRCIKPKRGRDVDVKNVAKVDSSLFPPSWTPLNLTVCPRMDLTSCDSISLEVPDKPLDGEKFPHLTFAVATTYERLQSSLPAFSHWLRHSNSRLIAIIVDGGPPNNLTTLEALYTSNHIDLHAVLPKRPGLSSDKNHFALVEDLLAATTPDTQWLSIIDDDTFFPSLSALSAALSKYDHTAETWLGALSEDQTAVERWGKQAFGGAGIFLSVPLVRKLVPHVDSCLAAATLPNGDKILQDCIKAHAPGTELTLVPGLWQLDIVGDASGFYEAGRSRPLLSLHHWKSWHKAPVVDMATVAKVCGDCFLQRWTFAHGVLFVNGFSITKYASNRVLEAMDLKRMESTWQQAGEDFDGALGPFREKLEAGSKKTWKLEEAVRGPYDGKLRQIYVRRGDREVGEIDEVLEMVWDN